MRSLINRILGTKQPRQDCVASRSPDSPTLKRAKCRIEVLEAINGRVLEVASREHDHEDWNIDLYIVRDDETLADAIATMLVLRGGK